MKSAEVRHGTHQGRNWHQKNGESLCPECARFFAAYHRERRRKQSPEDRARERAMHAEWMRKRRLKPGVREAERDQQNARERAITILANRHRDELRELTLAEMRGEAS
jgi:hypothetical protein